MAGSRVKKALAEPMPQKPSVGPAYADEVLVAAICARVKAGVTVSTALECAGLNKSTWIRWQEDAAKDGANPTLVETVNRIARARGEAKGQSCGLAKAGDRWVVTMCIIDIKDGTERMGVLRDGPTEEAALLAALEAAP